MFTDSQSGLTYITRSSFLVSCRVLYGSINSSMNSHGQGRKGSSSTVRDLPANDTGHDAGWAKIPRDACCVVANV
jgi:hypothetical protein